jgi:hypothetical protein
MKKELVIAAYDKDLFWVKSLNDDIKITIYRKGINNNDENEIFLEKNLGRCVHTFFNHILTNYNNLSDYTFFVQDYPFDHWENVVDILNGDLDKISSNATLNFDGYFGFHFRTKGMWELSNTNHFKNGNVLTCQSNGYPQDPGRNIDVDRYWNILFDHPTPNIYEFIPGGHFGINKETVKVRSIEFYNKIVNLLESEYISPWIIERLECYIFDKNYKSKI